MLGLGMRTSSIFNSQHVATRCNRVAKCVQHSFASDKVAICCVQMLRSFGRSLQMLGEQCWDMLRCDVAIVWPGLKLPITLCFKILHVRHCFIFNWRRKVTSFSRSLIFPYSGSRKKKEAVRGNNFKQKLAKVINDVSTLSGVSLTSKFIAKLFVKLT